MPQPHVVLSEAELALAKLCPDYALTTIDHLRITPKFTDATNGHYLVRVPHSEEYGDDQLTPPEAAAPVTDNLFLPRSLAMRMLAAIKGAAGRMIHHKDTKGLGIKKWKELGPRRFIAARIGKQPTLYTDHDEGKITLSGVKQYPGDDNFPEFDGLLALAENNPYTVTLSVEYLLKLAKWAEQYSACRPTGLAFFISSRPLDPVKLEIRLTDETTATAVLMPMRSYHYDSLPPERREAYKPTRSTPVVTKPS